MSLPFVTARFPFYSEGAPLKLDVLLGLTDQG